MAVGQFGADEAVFASGSDFSGAGTEAYTFTNPVKALMVSNHPSSGVNLYVWLNGTDAALTKWVDVIEPGECFTIPQNMGLLVKNLSLYSDGAATFKTNFTVVGWV